MKTDTRPDASDVDLELAHYAEGFDKDDALVLKLEITREFTLVDFARSCPPDVIYAITHNRVEGDAVIDSAAVDIVGEPFHVSGRWYIDGVSITLKQARAIANYELIAEMESRGYESLVRDRGGQWHEFRAQDEILDLPETVEPDRPPTPKPARRIIPG